MARGAGGGGGGGGGAAPQFAVCRRPGAHRALEAPSRRLPSRDLPPRRFGPVFLLLSASSASLHLGESSAFRENLGLFFYGGCRGIPFSRAACSTCPCAFLLLSPRLPLRRPRADVLCERLEMEVLMLWLFPWIFQCFSVRADSIIHIGKRGNAGGWSGRGGGGGEGRGR